MCGKGAPLQSGDRGWSPTSHSHFLLTEQEEGDSLPLGVFCLLVARLSRPPSTGQEGSESGVLLTC